VLEFILFIVVLAFCLLLAEFALFIAFAETFLFALARESKTAICLLLSFVPNSELLIAEAEILPSAFAMESSL